MKKRVLIVDDEPDMLRILSYHLSSLGYDVIPAYGGEHALKKIREARPDLIMTDLAMPGISGVELIERVKGDVETSSIPILAVTAYVWDDLASAAGSVGCDGYIGKPFDAQTLIEGIEKVLGHSDPEFLPPMPNARGAADATHEQ